MTRHVAWRRKADSRPKRRAYDVLVVSHVRVPGHAPTSSAVTVGEVHQERQTSDRNRHADSSVRGQGRTVWVAGNVDDDEFTSREAATIECLRRLGYDDVVAHLRAARAARVRTWGSA